MNFNKRSVLLVVVSVLLFFAFYFVTSQYLADNKEVDGFKLVPSRNFTSMLREVFSRSEYLVLKQELYELNDSRNTAIATASSELVFASLNLGKSIYNYGVINNVPLNKSNCNFDNRFCGQADVIVKIDESCNCLKIERGTLIISGSATFLTSHAITMRKVASAALKATPA